MTALQFNTYKVNKMEYDRNPSFDSSQQNILLTPKLSTNIKITESNTINLTLDVEVGTLEDDKVPFKASCSLTGNFSYEAEADEAKIGLDTLIRQNAVAILYPYVRTVIAMLTGTSNEFPSYNMPTINVAKVIEQQNGKGKD